MRDRNFFYNREEYWNNGNLKYTISFSDIDDSILRINYYDDGKLRLKENMNSDGLNHGEHVDLNPSGDLHCRGYHNNDVMVGKWYFGEWRNFVNQYYL